MSDEERCPSCGARRPAGAPWCPLCLAPTAAPPVPEAAPVPLSAPAPVPAGAVPAACDPSPAPPARGRHRAGARSGPSSNDLATLPPPSPLAVPGAAPARAPVAAPTPAALDEREVDEMLATLAAQESSRRARLPQGPRSKGGTLAVAAIGAVGLLALFVGASVVLTAVLG